MSDKLSPERVEELLRVLRVSPWAHPEYVDQIKNHIVALELEIEAVLQGAAEETAILNFFESHPDQLPQFRKGKWSCYRSMNYEYDVYKTLRVAALAAMARTETNPQKGLPMTDTEIRIAIAPLAGWKHQQGLPKAPDRCSWFKDETHHALQVLPNWPIDLNAMHEAEKVLITDDYQLRNKYAAELERVLEREMIKDDPNCIPDVIGFEWVHATARQRAEAFLRTLGLWKEQKDSQ